MKRDIQGKFTLKNDDYREVRSLRLTDDTWKALGLSAECLGITRADLIENVVRENHFTFPYPYTQTSETKLFQLGEENKRLKEQITFYNQEKAVLEQQILSLKQQLLILSEKVLEELKLGRQSPSYKLVQKALKRLIELTTILST